MECPICNKTSELEKFKLVKHSQILVCKDCDIALINNKMSNIKDIIDQYNLNSYDKQRRRFEKNFSRLKKIILKYKSKGDVLDIGAGFGLYDLILSPNFSISVVEPYFPQVYLKDIKHVLYNKNFEEFQTNKKFDLIIMMDIIEHFRDPSKALAKAKKFLKKDGIIVIQTPNYQSIMQYLVKDWSWWMTEDHKVVFSPKSLCKLFRRNCLKKIYFETYEPWIDFKKNLDGNFLRIKIIILRKIIKITILSLLVILYLPFRKFLWKLGYGGLIFTIVKSY